MDQITLDETLLRRDSSVLSLLLLQKFKVIQHTAWGIEAQALTQLS